MCYCPEHPGYRVDECPEPNCSCFHPKKKKASEKQPYALNHPEPPSSEEIDAMCET